MRRIYTTIASAILMLVSSFTAFGQTQPSQEMFDILNDFLTEEQATALTRLQEDIAKGEKITVTCDTWDKQNAKILAKKKGEKKSAETKLQRIKAAKYFEKSYQSLYDLYKTVLDEATFEFQADKSSADNYMAAAEETLQEGSTKMNTYNKLNLKNLETITYTKLKSDLQACKGKFESAGMQCLEAMKLYSVQADKKKKEVEAEQKFWNNAVNTNTVDSYNSYISKYSSGKYVNDAKRRISNLTTMTKAKRVTSNNPNEGLAYRIQILADTKQWTKRKLQRLYKGDLEIEERYCDNYYKYWVGCYRSYVDAQAAEQSMKLKESFIVCFKDGVQIHVTEAQELESQYE